jgi:hypothetical protein
MDEYARLIEKLRRIEALHAGATTPGERVAAAEAGRRVTDRLAGMKPPTPPKEYHFSMENQWSRKLFLALLRRHGVNPYRYYRQRYTTVMARVTDQQADSLWREFQAMNDALKSHLDTLAEKIISEAVGADTSEAEEMPAQLTGPEGEG